MDDPAKVAVALALFGSVSYTITSVARAWASRFRSAPRSDLLSGAAAERLERLEQAVDTIALEIERISEGQRFTTKLLAEQARQKEKPLELPSHTPV